MIQGTKESWHLHSQENWKVGYHQGHPIAGHPKIGPITIVREFHNVIDVMNVARLHIHLDGSVVRFIVSIE
jgi:hypothetical protein